MYKYLYKITPKRFTDEEYRKKRPLTEKKGPPRGVKTITERLYSRYNKQVNGENVH